MARLTIIMVTWNSAHWLPGGLGSLRQQKFKDYFLQVVDNASGDGSVGVVNEFFPEARMLRNFRNVGFCRAVNQGIRLARSEYILLLNPDVILQRNCLEELVAFADAHPQAGSFGPKLLRQAGNFSEAFDEEGSHFAPVFDSTGLSMNRRRLPKNRGEGLGDTGERYSGPEQVFGVSGACALYRRKTLDDVAIAGQYMDEDFFAYKEDADIAWRLRLRGHEIWYVPSAVAYHVRQVRQSLGIGRRWLSRRQVPRLLKILSAKNQYLMVIKNEQRKNFLRDSIHFVAYSLANLLLSITVEPFLWRAWVQGVRQFSSARTKRQVIQRNARVTPEAIRAWFINKN